MQQIRLSDGWSFDKWDELVNGELEIDAVAYVWPGLNGHSNRCPTKQPPELARAAIVHYISGLLLSATRPFPSNAH